MGAVQMGLGALVSGLASSFPAGSVLPMPLSMTIASVLATVILLLKRRDSKDPSHAELR
jgi:hypothetical protein